MAKFIMYIVLALTVLMNTDSQPVTVTPEIAVESENFCVDENMMTYFTATLIEPYSTYFSLMGVDTTQSLKTQMYTNDLSWYDYFSEYAKAYVGDYLILCEYAHENGIKLDKESSEYVSTYISSVAQIAEKYGYTTDGYLESVYGDGVTVDVLKKCLEIEQLATAAYNFFYENADYTDEELLSYRDENPSLFLGVDVLMYSFESYEFTQYDENGISVSTSEEDEKAARAAAADLRKAATEEEFAAKISTYLEETYGKDAAESYNPYTVHLTEYNFFESGAKWAFSADVGDIFIEDDGFEYTVYMLVKTPYLDESTAKNARIIYIDAETYDYTEVEKAFAEWEASGFTDEKFANLAETYNDYIESGEYNEIARDMFDIEVEWWLFDEPRTIGDRDIVESAYGWYIVEYLGESDCASWEILAREYMASADYEAYIEAQGDSITYYDDVIAGLNF